jgi:hypothetical protein
MPSLRETIEGFRKYDRIVVTGPQRAGTQIASKIIAKELGWKFVKEDVWWHDPPRGEHDVKYQKWVTNPETKGMVLQCPAISHACHATPKGTLVVFMIRPVEEILASDDHRRSKFKRRWIDAPVNSVFKTKRITYSKLFYKDRILEREEVPQAIYDVWNELQKKEDFDYCELEYKRLETHPLWIPLETRRTKFTSGTQTNLGKQI